MKVATTSAIDTGSPDLIFVYIPERGVTSARLYLPCTSDYLFHLLLQLRVRRPRLRAFSNGTRNVIRSCSI